MTTCTDEPVHLLCQAFSEEGECLVMPTAVPVFYGHGSGYCAQCGKATVTATVDGKYLHERCAVLYSTPKVEGTKPKGAFARFAAKKKGPL